MEGPGSPASLGRPSRSSETTEDSVDGSPPFSRASIHPSASRARVMSHRSWQAAVTSFEELRPLATILEVHEKTGDGVTSYKVLLSTRGNSRPGKRKLEQCCDGVWTPAPQAEWQDLRDKWECNGYKLIKRIDDKKQGQRTDLAPKPHEALLCHEQVGTPEEVEGAARMVQEAHDDVRLDDTCTQELLQELMDSPVGSPRWLSPPPPPFAPLPPASSSSSCSLQSQVGPWSPDVAQLAPDDSQTPLEGVLGHQHTRHFSTPSANHLGRRFDFSQNGMANLGGQPSPLLARQIVFREGRLPPPVCDLFD